MDIEPESPAAAAGNPRTFVRLSYHRAIVAAGGWPVPLAPVVELIPAQLGAVDGVLFTGGDDPIMEEFGVATHPAATPLHPLRQRYELALLEALDGRPAVPVLGVCLGMQLMALRAGGRLDQHLPESLPTAAEHWECEHEVIPDAVAPAWLAGGAVLSRHRQAIRDPGRLRVAARAPDGVIEAVVDPERVFYCGVQWHPERTEGALGVAVYRALVRRATDLL
jgi:putative glutamine amidotransferase